ncbi:MAG: GNAT family N-acetyltransferase [Thaumarchaeota archaeon]|nr:GNAT family N-acetyltransferase [Nitrososphaerota archaeon]
MDPEQIRLEVEENWGDCCVATGGALHEILGAKAYTNPIARRAAGHSNVVLRLRAKYADYFELIEKANELFAQQKLAYAWYESPTPKEKSVEETFLSKGLSNSGEQTYMIWEGKAPQKDRPKVETRIADASTVKLWAEVIYTSFGWPEDTKTGWTECMVKAVKKDDSVRPILAYVDGKPAGGLLLYSNHKTGGIYEVGTHPDFRGRGVAAASVLRGVEESKNRGDRMLWLRTTRGYAEQMYKKLGLITVYRGVSYRFSPPR